MWPRSDPALTLLFQLQDGSVQHAGQKVPTQVSWVLHHQVMQHLHGGRETCWLKSHSSHEHLLTTAGSASGPGADY